MSPKRDPRSSPKRPKIDIKNDMVLSDEKAQVRHLPHFELGVVFPPRVPPGGAPGTQGTTHVCLYKVIDLSKKYSRILYSIEF